MALDPSLAEVNFAQAAYIFFLEPDWRRAEVFLRRAIEINPRFAGALMYLALVLGTDERGGEIAALVDRARNADPLSAYAHFLVACAYFVNGQHAQAQMAAGRVLELQPDALPGWFMLGLAESALERHQAAIDAAERAVTISRAPFYVGVLGLVLARGGRPGGCARAARRAGGPRRSWRVRHTAIAPADSRRPR